MNTTKFLSTMCFLWLCCQLPNQSARATTSCAYNFATGSGNNLLKYCVTANGNIPQIQGPSGVSLIATGRSEGYGICNESPAQNYTDYGVSSTGNWRPSVLLSQTSSSVQIARTTNDGNWTLTQTISETNSSAINVVMALKNNQAVQRVAYLVRYAEPFPETFFEGADSALGWNDDYNSNTNTPGLGLVLQNVGKPPFGFWQGYVQMVPSGPNACAFAYYAAINGSYQGSGSIEIAYVGPVLAGGTNTITLGYRPF